MTHITPAPSQNHSKLSARWLAVVFALLVLIFAQCMVTAKRDSVNWDESQHLYSGWLSWTHGDFGFNPEVPPLIKMWDALLLLHRQIRQPTYLGTEFKHEGFDLGRKFMALNGIERTLMPARIMASLLTVMLAILLFVAAREMFGVAAAVFALALFTFDPNFLAHGSYVTTDIGAALTTLLSVWAFYRFWKRPSTMRILFVGVAVGLAMTAKFTGVLIVPILALIAIAELWRRRIGKSPIATKASMRQMVLALFLASAFGFASIWAIYGFRYQARPAGLEMKPPTSTYLQQLNSPVTRGAMTFFARHHLLPEAYLYGLADTKISASEDPCYFFGRMYLHAPRLYFPAALLIKSTIPFLVLLLMTIVLIAMRRWPVDKEILFLAIPAVVLFAVATLSDIGIGFRHVFPIFPLLYILVAGAAFAYLRRDRRWRFVLGILLIWQIATATASGPSRLAYANEAWGGSSRTHLYLSDSNTDWGQQLTAVKAWLDAHPGEPCYFAYFAQGPVDFNDYGIHCQQLPTVSGSWLGFAPMRFGLEAAISGIVLISDGDLAGIDREGKLNPYEKFRTLRPTATIDHGVYVYDGSFNLPLAAAFSHAEVAQGLLQQKRYDEALDEAKIAIQLAPENVDALTAEGDALNGLRRTSEAKAAYAAALHSAQTIEPEFQIGAVPALQAKVNGQQP